MRTATEISFAGLSETVYDSVKQPPALAALESIIDDIKDAHVLPITNKKFSITISVDSTGVDSTSMGLTFKQYHDGHYVTLALKAEERAFKHFMEKLVLHPVIVASGGDVPIPTVITTDANGVNLFSHPTPSFMHTDKEVTFDGPIGKIKFTYELPATAKPNEIVYFLPWIENYDKVMEKFHQEMVMRDDPSVDYILNDLRVDGTLLPVTQFGTLELAFTRSTITNEDGSYTTVGLTSVVGLIGAIVVDVKSYKSPTAFGISKSSYTTFNGLKEN